VLSINECHTILNDGASEEHFTRDEAELLRNFLNDFADITFDAFNKKEEDDKDDTKKLKGKKSNRLHKS